MGPVLAGLSANAYFRLNPFHVFPSGMNASAIINSHNLQCNQALDAS